MADETASRYRPQQVRVLDTLEAMQWLPDIPEATGALVGWLSSWSVQFWHPGGAGAGTKLALRGLEQDFFAGQGDWVLRGVTGGFFTVSAEEFPTLYEPESAGEDRVRAAVDTERARLIRALTTGPEGEHLYLSTGCWHGDRAYCEGMTGLAGAKRPASCKGCGAGCLGDHDRREASGG